MATKKKQAPPTPAVPPEGQNPNAGTQVNPIVQPVHSASSAKAPASGPPETYLSKLFALFDLPDTSGRISKMQALISDELGSILDLSPISKSSNVLIMFDEGTLLRSDADAMYRAITSLKDKKPVVLILFSRGGRIEPAYLISKLCREYSSGKFIAVVPRQAKSAATLLCCGADEIHMGSMSELGPIDPQIDSMPALGLKNAIQHLAELTTQFPSSASMFSQYLQHSLPLIHLGYYERVVESAVQYAERLLMARGSESHDKAMTIAKNLVYGYKDHGFVIDQQEATKIFGSKVIQCNTPEYDLGNSIYSTLSLTLAVCDFHNYNFHHYGTNKSLCNISKKNPNS